METSGDIGMSGKFYNGSSSTDDWWLMSCTAVVVFEYQNSYSPEKREK